MDEEVLALVKEISNYFEKHPRAADSSAGIRKWWLANNERATAEKVDQALQYLCDKGVVQKLVGETGQAVFSSSIKFNSREIETGKNKP